MQYNRLKKLAIHRETVRLLSGAELGFPRGGCHGHGNGNGNGNGNAPGEGETDNIRLGTGHNSRNC